METPLYSNGVNDLKLNFLIREEFKPSVTYLKRGRLCKKLLMYDDAYSDFTYVIGHCAHKKEAYYERLAKFSVDNQALKERLGWKIGFLPADYREKAKELIGLNK